MRSEPLTVLDVTGYRQYSLSRGLQLVVYALERNERKVRNGRRPRIDQNDLPIGLNRDIGVRSIKGMHDREYVPRWPRGHGERAEQIGIAA